MMDSNAHSWPGGRGRGEGEQRRPRRPLSKNVLEVSFAAAAAGPSFQLGQKKFNHQWLYCHSD